MTENGTIKTFLPVLRAAWSVFLFGDCRPEHDIQLIPGNVLDATMPDDIHFSKASSPSVFMPNFFINQLGGQKPVKEL